MSDELEDIDIVELLKFLKKREELIKALSKIPRAEREEFPEGKRIKKVG